jgi:hypothetical protein
MVAWRFLLNLLGDPEAHHFFTEIEWLPPLWSDQRQSSRGDEGTRLRPDHAHVEGNRRNEGELLLWDMAACKSRPLFQGTLSAVNALAFSPDGRILAVSLADKTVKLCEMPAGTVRKTIPLGADAVSIAFHSNGLILAAGQNNGKIALLDATDGHELTKFCIVESDERPRWLRATYRGEG